MNVFCVVINLYSVLSTGFLRPYNTICVTKHNKKNISCTPCASQLHPKDQFDVITDAASKGRDTYHRGQPCCRRRARRNLRCRTWRRPRSDWSRCTARRTAPSSGGGNCPAAPYLLAAPWGRTVCRADGFSSSGGGEPKSLQAGTCCHTDCFLLGPTEVKPNMLNMFHVRYRLKIREK